MQFSDEILYKAAHVIYSSEFADCLERRGGNFRGGENICDSVPDLTPAEHDPIIRPILAKIESKLGKPLADIFAAGGITGEHEQYDALSDLLLGVRGHGVCILDSYADQWEAGCAALGVNPDSLPNDEMTGYYELADEKITEAGYPPEPADGAELDESYTPIIETAFSWHGGQESSLYAFASTKRVQSEPHREGTLREIDRCCKIAVEKLGQAIDAGTDRTEAQAEFDNLHRLRTAVAYAKLNREFLYV
jgi:hypothetical protein